MPLPLETQRMILAPTQVEDAAFFYRLMNSPRWIRFIGDRKIHSISAAREFIEFRILPQIDRLGYGSFTLYRKQDNEKVGVCGVYDRNGVEGLDLGFALLPEFMGLGYASEGAKRLLQAASEDFHLKELKAITHPENSASQRLLEKLGFRYTRDIRLPGEEKDVFLFEIALDDSTTGPPLS